MKLNTDEASKGNPKRAGIGGVIRDSLGIALGGFAEYIGNASNTVAEIRDILRDI